MAAAIRIQFAFMDPPSSMVRLDRDLRSERTILKEDESKFEENSTYCSRVLKNPGKYIPEERVKAWIYRAKFLSKQWRPEKNQEPVDFISAKKDLHAALNCIEQSSVPNGPWLKAGIYKYLASMCLQEAALKKENSQRHFARAKEICDSHYFPIFEWPKDFANDKFLKQYEDALRHPLLSERDARESYLSGCGKVLDAPYRSGESPSLEEGVLQNQSLGNLLNEARELFSSDVALAQKKLEKALDLLNAATIPDQIRAVVLKSLEYGRTIQEYDEIFKNFLPSKNEPLKSLLSQAKDLFWSNPEIAQRKFREALPLLNEIDTPEAVQVKRGVQQYLNYENVLREYNEILECPFLCNNPDLKELLCQAREFSSLNLETTQKALERAQSLLDEMVIPGATWIKAVVLNGLAYVYFQGNVSLQEEARKYYQKGWETCKSLGGWEGRECQKEWEIRRSHRTLAIDYVRFLRDCFEDRLSMGYVKNAREDPDLELAMEICRIAAEEHLQCPDFIYHRVHINNAREEWKEVDDGNYFFSRLTEEGVSIREKYRLEVLDLSIKACRKVNDCAKAILRMKDAWEFESIASELARRARELLNQRLMKPIPVDDRMLNAAIDLATSYRSGNHSDEALELFGQVPSYYGDSLLFFQQFEMLLGQIKAHLTKKDLETVEALLQTASDFVNEWRGHFGDDARRRRAQILCCRACVESERGNFDKARELFEQASPIFKLDGEWKFALRYIDFLEKQGDFERALRVCQEAHPSETVDSLFRQAHLCEKLKDLEGAKKACDGFLRITQGRGDPRRLVILDLVIEIGASSGNFLRYLQMAFKEDFSPKVVQRAEELLNYPGVSPQQIYWQIHEKALKIAPKNPALALQLFSKIRDAGYFLPPLSEIPVLIAEARALIQTNDFAAACPKLDKVWELLGPPNLFPSEGYLASKKAEVCSLYALLARLEKKEKAEIIEHYAKGFEVSSSERHLVAGYIEFLMEQEEFEETLAVCRSSKLDEENRLCFELKLNLSLGRLAEAYGVLDLYLKRYREFSLELLDLMIPACMEAQDYKKAHEYALFTYNLDQSPQRFKKRFTAYLEAAKALIVDKHLKWAIEQVKKKFEETLGGTFQKIIYLTSLLEQHAEYLEKHAKHHLNILQLRRQFYLQRKDFNAARQDEESISKILASGKVPQLQAEPPFEIGQYLINAWRRFSLRGRIQLYTQTT